MFIAIKTTFVGFLCGLCHAFIFIYGTSILLKRLKPNLVFMQLLSLIRIFALVGILLFLNKLFGFSLPLLLFGCFLGWLFYFVVGGGFGISYI